MNFFLTKKQRIQNLFKKQKDFFCGGGEVGGVRKRNRIRYVNKN